jgi:hypothetical protein
LLPVRLKAGIAELEEMAVPKQSLGKHDYSTTNIHATIEELLSAVSPMRSVSYQILNL